MPDRMDQVRQLLREEREQLEAELKGVEGQRESIRARLTQVSQTLGGLQDVSPPAPRPLTPRPIHPEEAALYRVDEVALATLVREWGVRPSRTKYTATKLERLYPDVVAQGPDGEPTGGFPVCLGLLTYFSQPHVGLVECFPPPSPRAKPRYRITARGVQYLQYCQRREYAQALALLPASTSLDQEQLEAAILGIFSAEPAHYGATWLRVDLLNGGTYGSDLGPRLMEAINRLLLEQLIARETTHQRGVVYRLTVQGRKVRGGYTPRPPRPRLDRSDTAREVLRSIDQLHASERVAVLPAIQRRLHKRFDPESVPPVAELRKVADGLRNQGLIRSTSKRVKDDSGPGDEVWQDYALTSTGRKQLRGAPRPA